MIATVFNHTRSRQRRLLLAFFVLNSLPLLLFRLLVNPPFLVNYFIESNLTNETAPFLCAPSMVVYRGISNSAPGKSKLLVLSVLGPPRYKEKKLSFPGCAPSITAADEVWFYEVAPQAAIMLAFTGDICTLARGFRNREDIDYQEWKAKQIENRAIGQTQPEIEAWLGHCFVKYPEIAQLVLTALGSRSSASSLKDAPGEFGIDSGSAIMLEMSNGRCTKVTPVAIFH